MAGLPASVAVPGSEGSHQLMGGGPHCPVTSPDGDHVLAWPPLDEAGDPTPDTGGPGPGLE